MDLRRADQLRCLGCLREHYIMNVSFVSAGGVRCECGYVSVQMPTIEYRRRLAARRREAGQRES